MDIHNPPSAALPADLQAATESAKNTLSITEAEIARLGKLLTQMQKDVRTAHLEHTDTQSKVEELGKSKDLLTADIIALSSAKENLDKNIADGQAKVSGQNAILAANAQKHDERESRIRAKELFLDERDTDIGSKEVSLSERISTHLKNVSTLREAIASLG